MLLLVCAAPDTINYLYTSYGARSKKRPALNRAISIDRFYSCAVQQVFGHIPDNDQTYPGLMIFTFSKSMLRLSPF